MERCNLYVGQKVVCVNAHLSEEYYRRHPEYSRGLDGLCEGKIYTIRAIARAHPKYVLDFGSSADMVWVHLEEIVRELNSGAYEPGYRYDRFRPATDISALEALLKTAKPPAKQREHETT